MHMSMYKELDTVFRVLPWVVGFALLGIVASIAAIGYLIGSL